MGDALIENGISKYCMPDYIIMDQDSSFMFSLMNYSFKKKQWHLTTINHYRQNMVKTLSTILTIHLKDLGQMWPKYLPLATLAYNTFNTPNLPNYSLYELVSSRKPKLLLNLETNPNIKVSGTFKDYYTLLNKRLQYLHKLLQEFRSKRLAMINKDRFRF